MAFRRAAERFRPMAVSFSLRWECLRRESTVLLRPERQRSMAAGVCDGSGHGPTRPMPRPARIVTERLARFVSLRAIVGCRCVPIRRARRQRSEPSSLEKSRTRFKKRASQVHCRETRGSLIRTSWRVTATGVGCARSGCCSRWCHERTEHLHQVRGRQQIVHHDLAIGEAVVRQGPGPSSRFRRRE